MALKNKLDSTVYSNRNASSLKSRAVPSPDQPDLRGSHLVSSLFQKSLGAGCGSNQPSPLSAGIQGLVVGSSAEAQKAEDQAARGYPPVREPGEAVRDAAGSKEVLRGEPWDAALQDVPEGAEAQRRQLIVDLAKELCARR